MRGQLLAHALYLGNDPTRPSPAGNRQSDLGCSGGMLWLPGGHMSACLTGKSYRAVAAVHGWQARQGVLVAGERRLSATQPQ